MPFSLYLQQSAVSNAQLKQYASTAQLFDMVKWTKEAYNHFGVPYFDTCCQAEPFNIDLYISDDAGNLMSIGADGKLTVNIVTIAANLVSAQAGNNIVVSGLDGKLWAPQVSGMVYATGTTNYIAKFQGATSLINSRISDTGTVLSISALTNASASNILYYNPSTSAVTQADLTSFISGTPYYISLFDSTGKAITNSQLWTGSSKQTLLLDGAPIGTVGTYPQPLIIRQWSSYTGSDPSQYPGFDVYNLQPSGSGTDGVGAGLNLRGYYKNTFAGMYSQSLSDYNSNLRFYITNAGTKSDALYISSNTYVGIGTTAPTAQLHVSGTTKLQGIANTTTSNALYYDSSTGTVTYGAISPTNVSRVYISSPTNFTNASYITLATFNVGNASVVKTYKFYYNGNINTNAGIQIKIGGTAARNAIYLVSTALDGSGSPITSYSFSLTNPAYTGPTFIISGGNNLFSKIEGTVQFAAGVTGTLTFEISATSAGSPNYVQTGALIELTEI